MDDLTMQHAPSDEVSHAGCHMLDLDEASLCAIFSWLSPAELATAAQVCSTAARAARTNLLWLAHIKQQFGVELACSSHAQPAAAMALYQCLLRECMGRPKALPCRAVATDGGCDDPNNSTYWADNLFRYTVSDLYCSDAGTSNVHVIGRMLPHPSTPGARMEDVLPELQQSTDAIRDFIFDRCLCTAQKLISSGVVADVVAAEAAAAAEAPCAHAAGVGTSAGSVQQAGPYSSSSHHHQHQHCQQQQQHDGVTTSSSSGGNGGRSGLLHSLSTLGRSMWNGGSGAATASQRLQEQRQMATAAALASCSTRGLCDFFAESYNARQHGDAWAEGFFKGLKTDGDIHKMHMIMFALWSEQVQGRNRRLTLQRWPLAPRPPLAATAAAPAAGPAAAVRPMPQQQQQQQRQQQQRERELLCDVDQLLLLKQAALVDSTCLVQELVIGRGAHATCPLSSGLIYFGCQQQHQQHQQTAAEALPTQQQQQQQTAAAPQAAATAAAAAAESGSDSQAAAAGAALSADLGQLLQQPFVAASNGLSSAAAVFAAVDAGQLPPVLDYAESPAWEWIEFERPSQQQLTQQQQQQQQTAQGLSSSSSSSSSELSGVVMLPALWFRFKPGLATRVVAADGDDDGDDDDEEENGPLQFEPPVEVIAAAAQNIAAHAAANGENPLDAVFDAFADYGAAGLLAPQPQGPAGGHAAAAAAAGDGNGGSQQAASGVAVAAAAAAASPAAAAADDGPDDNAPAVPLLLPRQATPWPTCDSNPLLPGAAPEVAAALGWYPSSEQHPISLAVRLQKPRLAQLLCVKLIDSEDCSPEFNRERGGCNIDCEMVMCRGVDLVDVLQLQQGAEDEMAAPGVRLLGAAAAGGGDGDGGGDAK